MKVLSSQKPSSLGYVEFEKFSLKVLAQFKTMCYKCFLRDPLQRLLKLFQSIENIYLYEKKKHLNNLLLALGLFKNYFPCH